MLKERQTPAFPAQEPRTLSPKGACASASRALQGDQRPDGHWVYPLESDATMPADYLILHHWLDTLDAGRAERVARYLRRVRTPGGGWPLYPGAVDDLSASVRAYVALAIAGDAPTAPHMREARATIRSLGGAAGANVFTRIQLALLGLVPWEAVPNVPPGFVRIPSRAPVSIWSVSYWSRVTLVPLSVLHALRPASRAASPVRVDEMLGDAPGRMLSPAGAGTPAGVAFRILDRAIGTIGPRLPARFREGSLDRAVAFVRERLNGGDGLGAILPPMAYAVMMFEALGVDPASSEVRLAREAVERLVVDDGDEAYAQPCVSPVWDTALAAHALAERAGSGDPAAGRAVSAACRWLAGRQILDVAGDWAARRPGLAPGGWAFQYANPHYPDVDDTAVVAMLLARNGDPAHGPAVERARTWILGMQGRDGAWGAFEAENDQSYLNHHPFADHGALLDPPSEDVTARCVSLLCALGRDADRPAVERAVSYLRAAQGADGAWYGRWGTNYLYGTWSVLSALCAAGIPASDPCVTAGAAFLERTQRPDGGWGESADGYASGAYAPATSPMPSQTAWAMLGLMAAGRASGLAAARGAAHLRGSQDASGGWSDPLYNAVGFPRVFYLKYHGYPRYFPLLALARFERLRAAGLDRTDVAF